MNIADYFSIAIVSIMWIASFLRVAEGRRFSFAKWGTATAIMGIIVIVAYFTHAQFMLWRANEVSSYLLPPYHSLSYFLFYVWTRLWAPYAVSLTVGLLGFVVVKLLNKRFDGRFFEREELYYIATGLFVSGHPGWITYGILVLGTYLLFSIFYLLYFRDMRRVSFYYSWLPLAVLAIVLNAFLLNYNWYNNFII